THPGLRFRLLAPRSARSPLLHRTGIRLLARRLTRNGPVTIPLTMPWTYYKSTDASAPAPTGQLGSLIALLDAILVTGYGSTPGAGWTEAFSGSDKAAYRMGSGRSQMYVRIDDSGPGGQGPREARINGFEAMTDVDTGTNNIVG